MRRRRWVETFWLGLRLAELRPFPSPHTRIDAMTSYRVLDGYRVERRPDRSVYLDAELPSGFVFGADDLRALLHFAETGEEPPVTDAEREAERKGEATRRFLDGLIRENPVG